MSSESWTLAWVKFDGVSLVISVDVDDVDLARVFDVLKDSVLDDMDVLMELSEPVCFFLDLG